MESPQEKEDNSIRDYDLMRKIDRLYSTLTKEELKAAHSVVAIIAHHLNTKHFDKKIKINIKALIKTLGELDENGIELLYNIYEVK